MTVATKKPNTGKQPTHPQAGRQSVVESFGSAFALESTADDRVDLANSTIKHAKILGLESLNGRDYRKPIAQKKIIAIYEGAPVGVGHVKNANENRNGSYGDFNGFFKNVVAESDGFYGDHVCNPEHPSTKQLLWDAQHNPRNVGYSQHADITTSRGANGKQVVESIDAVHSVDVVNKPATTNGIFESQENKEPIMQMKLQAILEAAEANSRSVLEEMMAGSGATGEMPVEVKDGATGDDQTKAAFRSMVMAKFDDDSLDAKATAAAIKNILQAYDKVKAPAAGGDVTPASEASKGPTKESFDALAAENAALKAEKEIRKLVATEGVTISDVQLKACIVLEAAERVEFVKGLPKADAKPNTKPPSSSSVTEAAGSTTLPAKPFETPDDVRSFLKSS